jgi:transcriptional regulator with XRE-family HTH domain
VFNVMTRRIRFYRLYPSRLRSIRRKCGVSVRDFAKVAGWHRSYQHRLESGGSRIVSEFTLAVIVGAFDRFLRKRPDNISREIREDTRSRYYLDGVVLKKRREDLGITVSDFSEFCGWSQSYQRKLERRITMISGRESVF